MVTMRMLRTFGMLAVGLANLPAMAAQDVLLEAVLEPEQVYVQAQARYRLRFYHSVDVRDLVLHPPSARVADLRPLGDVRIYESMRDGRRYRVHERSYAVLPFASGELQLAGAHATGRIPASMPRSVDGRQAIRIDAPPRTLKVLPAPIADGHWLPARSLTLSESWVPAGAARRRTIRVEATGVNAAQLPALQFAAPGATVQALPARLENRIDGDQLVGIREQGFLVTPVRAGVISLPAVQLHWWTPDGAPMTATLPASSLQEHADALQVVRADADDEMKRHPVVSLHPLLWLAVVAAVLGIAVTHAFRRPYLLRLMLAGFHGDARTVRTGLLAWAARRWPDAPPRTLAALADLLQDARARRSLAQLDRSLYGAVDQKMDRTALRFTVLQVMRSALRRRYDSRASHHPTGASRYSNNTRRR